MGVLGSEHKLDAEVFKFSDLSRVLVDIALGVDYFAGSQNVLRHSLGSPLHLASFA